jgi:hypothetical protein
VGDDAELSHDARGLPEHFLFVVSLLRSRLKSQNEKVPLDIEASNERKKDFLAMVTSFKPCIFSEAEKYRAKVLLRRISSTTSEELIMLRCRRDVCNNRMKVST